MTSQIDLTDKTVEMNGGLTRLKTIEELNKTGCAYGQVNREKAENLEKRYNSIDLKLWGLIALLAGRWLAEYLLQAAPVKAMIGQ